MLIALCSLVAALCFGLWQKIKKLSKNHETPAHFHQTKVFQRLTPVQKDSIISEFYGTRIKLYHETWNDVSVYFMTDPVNDKLTKMVFFVEEDVPCPTCRDVYFLLELNKLKEITGIHFIQPFESFSGWISQEKMEFFKNQFLGRNILNDLGKFDAVTGATNSSRQFYQGLAHMKYVLQERGKKKKNVQ